MYQPLIQLLLPFGEDKARKSAELVPATREEVEEENRSFFDSLVDGAGAPAAELDQEIDTEPDPVPWG